MSREYGESVEVNYNDLALPSVRARFPSVAERLQKGDINLPAVFVDEEEVSRGYVDYFSIARAIEKARLARTASETS